MMRWAAFLLLWLAVVGTALAVVAQRHQARHLFVELQAVEVDRDRARTEWSRLQLEQAWLVESGRVEQQARGALGMQSPPEVMILEPSQ